jgi:hypothetical protein
MDKHNLCALMRLAQTIIPTPYNGNRTQRPNTTFVLLEEACRMRARISSSKTWGKVRPEMRTRTLERWFLVSWGAGGKLRLTNLTKETGG